MAGAIWGDGFASDSLFEAAAVSDWAQLAEGECVRLFPSLRPRRDEPDAELAKRVLDRADQIDAQVWLPAAHKFTDGRKPSRGVRASRFIWPTPTREDAIWLRSLITAREVRNRVSDLRPMARFAFLTGLHPAYLWLEVEALSNWGATAAWLGELSRHTRAFMPPEVAEYFIDALVSRRGAIVVRDATLADWLRDARLPALLLSAAERRLAGQNPVVDCEAGLIFWAASRCEAARKRVARSIAFLPHIIS